MAANKNEPPEARLSHSGVRSPNDLRPRRAVAYSIAVKLRPVYFGPCYLGPCYLGLWAPLAAVTAVRAGDACRDADAP
jgi:hypothetical protein